MKPIDLDTLLICPIIVYYLDYLFYCLNLTFEDVNEDEDIQ